MNSVTSARAQEILANLKTNPSRQVLALRALELGVVTGRTTRTPRALREGITKACDQIVAAQA